MYPFQDSSDTTEPPDESYWEHEAAEEPKKEAPQRVEVDLPWDLTPERLTFEDVREDHPPEACWKQILWLRDGTSFGEKELGRIFLAAGLLAAKFPDRPVRDCLEQAIVWERG